MEKRGQRGRGAHEVLCAWPLEGSSLATHTRSMTPDVLVPDGGKPDFRSLSVGFIVYFGVEREGEGVGCALENVRSLLDWIGTLS